MLVSKYKDKNGKTCVSMVFKRSMVKASKNPDYVRVTLSEDYQIGLDAKTQAPLEKVFNLKNLKDNTK